MKRVIAGLFLAVTILIAILMPLRRNELNPVYMPIGKFNNGVFYLEESAELSQFIGINFKEESAVVKFNNKKAFIVKFLNENTTLEVFPYKGGRGQLLFIVKNNGSDVIRCVISKEIGESLLESAPLDFRRKYIEISK